MEKLVEGTVVRVGQHTVEVREYLAEGGFAHIYKVLIQPKGAEACLKRVVVKDKSDLNQLRNEVDTMKRLVASPYVVKYYDSNAQKLESGEYEVLLLMEYCPNKSLLDYMNGHIKTKLTVDRITNIMYQITMAIGYMHSLNMIHRDLKIENVLRDAEGVFKLADFGSASNFIPVPKSQEEVQILATDIIRNTTPQYRAPEMIDLYKNLAIDNKSDIWALGVFLYKLMYYTTPFERQGELAILHGYFEFPNHPQYPSRLKNLVIIMLQVNPMLRPNAYQVLHEVCSMMAVPVPMEDFNGIGAYDFDAYAHYQQHVQLQQQQQQKLEQDYLERKHREQEQSKQLQVESSTTSPEVNTAAVEPQPQAQPQFNEIQPHALTRSSKSSVGDLRSMNAKDDEHEDDNDVDENSIPELDDVEDRFPDLDELDKDMENKYPAITGKSDTSSENTRELHKPVPVQVEDADKKESVVARGLKLTKTEAWTVPAESTNGELEVDVFHRASTEGAKPKKTSIEIPRSENITPSKQTKPPLLPKSSFDSLFDFERSNGTDGIPKSRNPFPTSKNPFPTMSETPSTLSIKKNILPQVSGGNPWAQYTQSTYQSQASLAGPPPGKSSSQSVKVAPPVSQVPVIAAQQQVQQPQPQHVVPVGQIIPIKQVLIQQPQPAHAKFAKQEMIQPPQPPPRPTINEGQLIDLQNTKEQRPKLNLDLLDMDISGHQMNVGKGGDDSPDSSNVLKVEVMNVRDGRSPRSSAEIQRLQFKMEELDLDDDDAADGDRRVKASRSSVSLRRSSSRKTSKQENRKSWFKS